MIQLLAASLCARVRSYEHIVGNDAPKLDICRREPFLIGLDSVAQSAKSRVASFPRSTNKIHGRALNHTPIAPKTFSSVFIP
jgi:hypothetical protein